MAGSEREAGTNAADAAATLELLAAVEQQPNISQRGLAQRLGAALGLTNAYFKRAVRKGYIKVSQAPARRFLYYLTPLGFIEKARLTQEYLAHSLEFFRLARAECDDLIARAANRGWRRIAIFGASELAEIASLSARDQPVELVAVVDAATNTDRYAGARVVRDLAELDGVDAILVADVRNPQAAYDMLVGRLPAERILCPSILRVSGSGPRPGGTD